MNVTKCTYDEAMKADESFQPLLLAKILADTINEIAIHKKDRDDAQKARLETALKILGTKNIAMPAYPDKTLKSLTEQMEKQLKKINKKK